MSLLLQTRWLLVWLSIATGNIFMAEGSQIENNVNISGRRLDDKVFRTLLKISLNQCKKECKKRIDCFSINYCRLRTLCELNSVTVTSDSSLIVAPGFVFYSIPQVTNVNDIIEQPCPRGQVLQAGGGCKIEECHTNVTLVDPTAALYGNMKAEGSILKYTCISLPGNQYTTCLSDGDWSTSLDNLCGSKCPVPSTIFGTQIDQLSAYNDTSLVSLTSQTTDILETLNYFDGSFVQYSCLEGLGSSATGRQDCQAGVWSETSLKCDHNYNQGCETDSDCSYLNLICYNRYCNCSPGKHFSYIESQCVSVCPHGIGILDHYYYGTEMSTSVDYLTMMTFDEESTCFESFNNNVPASKCVVINYDTKRCYLYEQPPTSESDVQSTTQSVIMYLYDCK
ncbi:hypothetical protein ACF0H5_023889 [Mactra antiquata]